MPREIYIRADGGPELGLGHLVRCLSLAHMLKTDFTIHFFSIKAPEGLIAEIRKEFAFTKINQEHDFLENLSGKEIVLLDHYGLDSDYQKSIKGKGCKLVCIDDLHDKYFYADLIINHAPGITLNHYKAEPYTSFALGPDYALLKPIFLEQAKKNRVVDKSENVFICFGGADPLDVTSKVLKTVVAAAVFKRITVVTGMAYQNQGSLVKNYSSNDVIEFYNDLQDVEMLALMSSSDIAIVPSSGILFECLASGCKTICSYYIDNQQNIYKGFKALNAIYPINGFNELNKADFSEIKSFTPVKVIDGLSGERLVDFFKRL